MVTADTKSVSSQGFPRNIPHHRLIPSRTKVKEPMMEKVRRAWMTASSGGPNTRPFSILLKSAYTNQSLTKSISSRKTMRMKTTFRHVEFLSGVQSWQQGLMTKFSGKVRFWKHKCEF